MVSRMRFVLYNTFAYSRATSKIKVNVNNLSRFSSTIHRHEATQLRSELFSKEKKSQIEKIGRIKKIEVNVSCKAATARLMMNQNISTPHDCAKHISEHVVKTSVVALVNGEQPWDMHRPLEDSCNLTLLTMTDNDPRLCNTVFWRSCSFVLGAVVSNAFKDEIPVTLRSFPPPKVSSGSFVLDAFVGIKNWIPSPQELRALSSYMLKIANKELYLERLSISSDLAKEMFSENPVKLKHINSISKHYNDIVVYRIGDHVDISRGPLMNHSGLIGRCSIAGVHKVEDYYRFQGVALPKGMRLNHFAYGILESRAQKLNTSGFQPWKESDHFHPHIEESEEATEVKVSNF